MKMIFCKMSWLKTQAKKTSNKVSNLHLTKGEIKSFIQETILLISIILEILIEVDILYLSKFIILSN